jgi:hypothetical protein
MADDDAPQSIRRKNVIYTEVIATPAKPAGWTLRDLRNMVDVTLDFPGSMPVSINSREMYLRGDPLYPDDAEMPWTRAETVDDTVIERGPSTARTAYDATFRRSGKDRT